MATPRTNASHDQNFVPSLIGISTADGTTPVPIEVDPLTGAMQVSSSAGMTTIQGGYSEVAFTTTTTGVQQVATTDVSNYKYATLQLTSAGTSLAYTLQESSDNTNWSTILARNISSQANPWSTGSQGTGLITLEVYLHQRYLRVSITAMSAGTTTGVIELYAIPPPPSVLGVSQNGTFTVGSNSATGSAIPANAFYMGINNAGNLGSIQSVANQGDANGGASAIPVGGTVYNGATWDRMRSGPTTGSVLISAPTATAAAVPANAFYIGVKDGSGNLQGLNAASVNGDAQAGGNTLQSDVYLYNGSTFDRARNNEAVSLLASSARTTTQTSADIVNYNGLSALDVILDMTVVGTGSVTLTINGKDPASGKYYLLLAGAAVITNSTNRYKVGPLIAAAANAIAQDYVPRIFQIVVTANNANSATYSVGYNLSRDT